MTQRFAGAQWCDVTPFAMAKGDEYRSLTRLFGPATYMGPRNIRSKRKS